MLLWPRSRWSTRERGRQPIQYRWLHPGDAYQPYQTLDRGLFFTGPKSAGIARPWCRESQLSSPEGQQVHAHIAGEQPVPSPGQDPTNRPPRG